MTTRHEQLVEFVEAYRAAYDTKPHKATTLAAKTLGLSRATAIRRLAAAREAGLWVDGLHRPRRVRWTRGEGSWLACAECRQPWPCPEASEVS